MVCPIHVNRNVLNDFTSHIPMTIKSRTQDHAGEIFKSVILYGESLSSVLTLLVS